MPHSADDSRPDGAQAAALVITGMHRSGTSLATALLAAAGVHVGEQLMGPATGNPRGHFEDLEFVRLHEHILAANGLSHDGFTCHESIIVPPSLHADAQALRDRRRAPGRVWGWKDPRTTLVLDLWAGLIPEARFLFLVRPPWEVVDSLFRRGDEVFAIHPRLAVDLWVSYNRRILDFVQANRQRCRVIDTARMAADPAGFVNQVGVLLGRSLDQPRDVYEPELLETGRAGERSALVEGAHPESARLYAALRDLAGAGGSAERSDATGPDLATAAITEWWRGIARVRETQVRATADRAALENRLVAERDHDVAVACQQAADAAARWPAERAAFESERCDLERRLHTAHAELGVARATLARATLVHDTLVHDTLARRRRSIGERVVAEGRRFLRRVRSRIQRRSSRPACEAG
jgi:hypothetical protein